MAELLWRIEVEFFLCQMVDLRLRFVDFFSKFFREPLHRRLIEVDAGALHLQKDLNERDLDMFQDRKELQLLQALVKKLF